MNGTVLYLSELRKNPQMNVKVEVQYWCHLLMLYSDYLSV